MPRHHVFGHRVAPGDAEVPGAPFGEVLVELFLGFLRERERERERGRRGLRKC